jgi:HAD superfamily hydrolase (TIGR01509 family)
MEVVFDIGNVLLRWDPRNLYRHVFPQREAMETFLEGPLSLAFILETDVAPSFAAAIESRARTFPEDAERLRLFDSRWMETLGGAIEENVALLHRLKSGGARVHALSNFAHEKFALALEDYPFLKSFDVAVISGREGVAKPDPRIFALLVERVGRAPGDLLFIDDSPRNVEAARAFGVESILYAPGVDLARELGRRGLLA